MTGPFRLRGVLGLFFAFVFIPCESHAQFRAQWQTSISLDAEKPAMTQSVWGGRTDDRKRSSDPGVGRRSGLSDLLGTNSGNIPRRSFTEFGLSNWRDRVHMAAEEKKGPGALSKDLLNYNYTFGILPLSFSWSKYTRNNENAGYRGILIGGLGYYSKNYFNPPKMHSWNGFWHWGTVYLIFPWIGFGAEYTTEKFYFEIGTIYIIPYPGIGIHF